MNNHYENLKKQIKILNIVQNYLKVEKQGNNYVAVCPFHNDSRPSLSISESKNIFKCFACNAGGDGIGFIMKFEKLNFHEAFIKACQLSNISNNEYAFLEKNYEIKKPNLVLIELNNFIANTYINFLNSSDNQKVLNYLLEKRKINKKAIEKFKIGYAPNVSEDKFGNSVLKNIIKIYNKQLEKEKFSVQNLYDLGLLKINNQGQDYDFFLNRIVFPISNENNEVVGFSARVWNESDYNAPKYLNSETNVLFKKQEILYNLNNIYQNNNDFKEIYIVEGFMDTIALDSLEIENAVATMGTSFSPFQINLLNNYFKQNNKKVVLSLDNDSAGIQFTISLAEQLLKNGFSVFVTDFLETKLIGKDIDELIKNNNKENVVNLIKNPINYFEWFKKYYFLNNKNHDWDSINNIASYLIDLLFINNKNNFILKKHSSQDYVLNSIDHIFSFFNIFEKKSIKDYVNHLKNDLEAAVFNFKKQTTPKVYNNTDSQIFVDHYEKNTDDLDLKDFLLYESPVVAKEPSYKISTIKINDKIYDHFSVVLIFLFNYGNKIMHLFNEDLFNFKLINFSEKVDIHYFYLKEFIRKLILKFKNNDLILVNNSEEIIFFLEKNSFFENRYYLDLIKQLANKINIQINITKNQNEQILTTKFLENIVNLKWCFLDKQKKYYEFQLNSVANMQFNDISENLNKLEVIENIGNKFRETLREMKQLKTY